VARNPSIYGVRGHGCGQRAARASEGLLPPMIAYPGAAERIGVRRVRRIGRRVDGAAGEERRGPLRTAAVRQDVGKGIEHHGVPGDRRRGPEVLERAFGITSAEACASDDVLNRRTEICKLPAMLGGGFVRLTLEWEVTVHRLDTHLS